MADEREATTATIVGKWKTGYDHKNGTAVLVFEFADREPMYFVMPLDESVRLGHALVAQDAPGGPVPSRAN